MRLVLCGSTFVGLNFRLWRTWVADEAERGYDLSKAKRQFVGRPSLSGNGTSPRMSFRITPELYLAMEERAEREGRSVSDLAREAVARYVGS